MPAPPGSDATTKTLSSAALPAIRAAFDVHRLPLADDVDRRVGWAPIGALNYCF
jgi:hypothetical protein